MSVSLPLITYLHLYLPTLTFFYFLVYILLDRTYNPWPHINLSLHIFHFPSVAFVQNSITFSIGFQPNLTICFQISSSEFQQLITNHLALTLLLMIKSGFQICNQLHILRCTQIFFPKVHTVQQAGSPVNGAPHLLRLTHSWRIEVLLNSGFLPSFHWAYSGI